MSSRSRANTGCPVCGAPAATSHAPFCGQGCRDRDLLRWLGEGYRLPGPPADDRALSGLDSDDGRPL